MSNTLNRTWHKGFYAYWFKECGSLNYLLPMLIGVIISVLVMIKGLTEALPFTICFTSICAFASVSWQSIRLQATEWHSLVPGYTDHIVKQGNIIIVAPHVILLASAIIFEQYDVLKLLCISVLVGTLFYLKCRVTSKMFNSSSYFFFAIIGFTVAFKEVPTWLAALAVILNINLVLFRRHFGTAFKWQTQALVDYKHALQSGWSPIPKGFLKGYGQGLNKFFFPLSYFMGRSLIQYTVLVLIILVALLTLNYFYVAGRPSLFIFSNLVCILAFMILWTRIQRQQAWGTLITLPIYSSVMEAKINYAKASEKFALCIFVCSALLAGFIEFIRFASPVFNLSMTYSLVNTAGVLICFAIGNVCKKSAFFSVALVFTLGFVLAITGIVVETEAEKLGIEHSAGAFIYLLFAIFANRISSKQLYTNI
ncbi:hypothetical protein CWB72_08270 [Pseudoalteromonas phenolica]|uniref:hypothetical protein n=1 Tax=Pseudoalteromonas phenolica TaxID=161398 RepID=UPI00110A9581|nr:hypothetical protein [Pseudoalteromonas phenolica]TMN90525.1 hypothetical protein CWB72_08270 [Pseudoalteromonas phenolica]